MLKSNDGIKNKSFNLKPDQIRFFRSDIFPTKPVFNSLSDDVKPKDVKSLFYHSTTTIDYIIVTKGNLVMIVGDKETTLKAGDVVVQRGAAHAWHNYTDEVATIMGIMIGVHLPKQFKQIDTIQPD